MMTLVKIEKRGKCELREHNMYWIDHATVEPGDLKLLAGTAGLTLWNVKLPPGFLRRLKRLWWLDVRGGTGRDLSFVDAPRLRYLQVNQVRGLTDVSAIGKLTQLELLSLYGLPKVKGLPSLARLTKLKRVQLGNLIGLKDLRNLARAPALHELLIQNKLSIDAKALEPFKGKLRKFDWFAPDQPVAQVNGALDFLDLPQADAMSAEEWFKLR
jgi:hypothetical protein